MNEPMLWWALALLLAAAVVVAIEMFVPSGGLLAVLATGLSIASVVCFWRVSATWGIVSLSTLLVLAPLVVMFFFKIYPDTPMGRRMILSDDAPGESGAGPGTGSGAASAPDALAGLVGKIGDVVSDLRPVGLIRVEGARHEATSEHGVVEAGARVRVTSVEGGRVRVRVVA